MLKQISNGKLITKDPTMVVDTGATGLLDTTADSCVFDVKDLTDIEIWVNQIVDAGTATILVEKTIDGTNWEIVATLTEASFAAGANVAKSTSLSTGGLPLHATQLRVRATAVAAGGTYTAKVLGMQTELYR